MKPPPPCLLVLAAGRGSRYTAGGHKLARRWGHSTVLGSTVAAGLASGLPLKVVTTQPLLPLTHGVVPRADVVLLPEAGTDPQLGMGYSIAAGVTASLSAHGWLILPADMPLVTAATIRLMAATVQQHVVAYPQHQGRRGHPVAFGPGLVSELLALKGDEGARRILARFPAAAVDVDDPGVLMDFDTEADFQRVPALTM